jgi:hypothetical protein
MDHHGVAMMERPIEDGGGENLVAKHGAPLRDDLVGRDQEAATVAARHELEKQMRAAPFERQVAQLVDVQEFGLAENISRSASWPSVSALASAASRPVALVNSTEWPASMTARPSAIARWSCRRLARRRSGRFPLREKPARRELAHEPLIDRRLEFELELVEGLEDRKVRDLETHRHARALFRLDILAQHLIEEVE